MVPGPGQQLQISGKDSLPSQRRAPYRPGWHCALMSGDTDASVVDQLDKTVVDEELHLCLCRTAAAARESFGELASADARQLPGS